MRKDIWLALGCGLGISAVVSTVGGLGDAQTSRQVVEVLVASGVIGLISGVLCFVLFPLAKQVDQTARRNRRLWMVFFVLVAVWMLTHGPFRAWAGAAGLGGHWILGVAPSLFAGLAVALASALVYGFRPLTAGAFGAGFIILTEVIQPWLPRYKFDFWDVAVGLVGAGLAVLLLMRWPVAVHNKSAPN